MAVSFSVRSEFDKTFERGRGAVVVGAGEAGDGRVEPLLLRE